tara:strand:- start:1962 stop:2543 length:582 start_codon:yes stop_codon:yes gene_type:complete
LKEIEKLGGDMRLAAEAWDAEWETLIATILSARSLDETTIKYASVLFERYPSVKALSEASVKDVEEIIRSINFYRNKSRNVISCCKELDKEYGGEVPKDFSKLIELPGVGAKTASVFLSEYGGDAIAVDTHVFYISRYLSWSSGETPDKVMDELMEFFPKKYWSKLNPVLVRFGKKYTSRREKDSLLERIRKL